MAKKKETIPENPDVDNLMGRKKIDTVRHIGGVLNYSAYAQDFYRLLEAIIDGKIPGLRFHPEEVE